MPGLDQSYYVDNAAVANSESAASNSEQAKQQNREPVETSYQVYDAGNAAVARNESTASISQQAKQLPDYESLPAASCKAGQDRVKRFVMVKVGKTGTTTLCHMMTRFIRLNNLSVVAQTISAAVQWWKGRNIGQCVVISYLIISACIMGYPHWIIICKGC